MKLAILFLTRGNIHNPSLWEKFISDSQGKAVVYAHAKNKEAVSQSIIKNNLIPEHIDTAWGNISLVRAQNLLLKNAIKDPDITHFAFVSESCIPIKSWEYVERTIIADPRSRLNIRDWVHLEHEHKRRKPAGIAEANWKFHSQWVLLDRKMAELILKEDMTSIFERSHAIDEHYYGTLFSLHGVLDGINYIHMTLVDWRGGKPIAYDTVTPEHQEKMDASPCFFARKFTPIKKP